MIGRILKYATLYKSAVSTDIHRWAGGIVEKAFQQVMGREPSQAERQIVMAVSNLESSYGQGWGHGQSTTGQNSHNWGAIQTRSTNVPSFSHGDSSVQGKYITKFKAYPNDIAGAADVVRELFKSSRKQQMPDPDKGQRAFGGEISGPTRSELIISAAQNGDTLAFSKAMWYTSYFEGTAADFTQRILQHAQGIQTRIDTIASALGETPAWSIKSDNYLPITNDTNVINKILQINPKAGGNTISPSKPSYSPIANPQLQMPAQQFPDTSTLENESDNFSGLSQMLWFE